MGCCCGPRGCGITGFVFAVIGAIMAGTLSLIVNTVINQQLEVREGTIMYGFWEDSPVPMYMRLYLYNVTNSEEVYKNQAKPIVEQLGPYTYLEKHYRVKVSNFDNDTMQFQQKRIWEFDQELSKGYLDDPIITVNPVVVSASYAIRDLGSIVKVPFNAALKRFNSTYFVTKTANQLLFEGFSDPLLDFAGEFPEGIFPPYDKFGWFYNRNGSDYYDGVFNIFTGVDDISKLLSMDLWNGTKQTHFYESYCGMVNGSYGEGWPPYRTRTNITMYSTDLCRSITLDYVEDVKDSGVTFYRYAGTKRMFANSTEEPDNWCFCPQGNCKPSGVIDSSVCRYGAPAFVSFPHFYNADPFYLQQVDGMKPEREHHEFHIDLEPRTAVPLQVHARFQINLLIEPIVGITITSSVPRTFLPVTWFEVSANLNDKPSLIKWIRFAVDSPLLGTISFFCFFVIGMFIVAASGITYAKQKNSKET